MKFKKLLGNKIIFILLIFAAVYFIFFFNFKQHSDLWWDSAAYIGVGKYIFSFGREGVFEPMRAPLLPLILGLFWKLGFLGFNVVYAGKIFIFFTAVFSLVFLYLISKELFNEKVASLSCIILFLNSLFFIFVFRIYTEILSIFLILASIFFMLKFSRSEKKFALFLSALFSVFAFLTKYPNLLIFGILNLFLIYRAFKTKKIKYFILFNLFFFILILPFLMSNYFLFKDPLHLMKISQNYYKANLGKMYSLKAFPLGPRFILKTDFIYFYSILLFFNILVPFMLFGAYQILKESSNKGKKIFLLVLPVLAFFCFFEIFYLKEERYLLPIYPLLALFSAYGLYNFKKKIIFPSIFIYIIISFVISAPFLTNFDERTYQNFFIAPPINFSCEKVITSDVRSAITYKTVFPYEVFDENFKDDNILRERPDCIFYFSCYEQRGEHIKKLNNLNYSVGYSKDTGRCLYAIFKK